jgi:hypothetical protein
VVPAVGSLGQRDIAGAENDKVARRVGISTTLTRDMRVVFVSAGPANVTTL